MNFMVRKKSRQVSAKKVGRPPEGVDAHGKPMRIRDYPKLLITIRPEMHARLKAMAVTLEKPAWKIVEEATNLYFEGLSAKDQRTIQRVARQAKLL